MQPSWPDQASTVWQKAEILVQSLTTSEPADSDQAQIEKHTVRLVELHWHVEIQPTTIYRCMIPLFVTTHSTTTIGIPIYKLFKFVNALLAVPHVDVDDITVRGSFAHPFT